MSVRKLIQKLLPSGARWSAPLFAAAACSAVLAGCSFGPRALRSDQLDYGRALGDAKKREILSTVVGLRYADAPGFLDVTQIIAAYNLDVNASVQAGSGNFTSGVGTYSNHPTFTFTPTTGQSYAKTYLRPLTPAQLLPLAQSGVPIDLLLRIAAQSIHGYRNATMLGGSNENGSPEFFELLRLLRTLQLAGSISIAFKPPGSDQVVVSFAQPSDGVAADRNVDHPAEVKVDHLSDDGGFGTADADSGASSGDTSVEAARLEHSGDCPGDRPVAGDGTAVPGATGSGDAIRPA